MAQLNFGKIFPIQKKSEKIGVRLRASAPVRISLYGWQTRLWKGLPFIVFLLVYAFPVFPAIAAGRQTNTLKCLVIRTGVTCFPSC